MQLVKHIISRLSNNIYCIEYVQQQSWVLTHSIMIEKDDL